MIVFALNTLAIRLKDILDYSSWGSIFFQLLTSNFVYFDFTSFVNQYDNPKAVYTTNNCNGYSCNWISVDISLLPWLFMVIDQIHWGSIPTFYCSCSYQFSSLEKYLLKSTEMSISIKRHKRVLSLNITVTW